MNNQNAAPEAVAWRYKFRLRNGELSKWLTTEYPPRAGAEVVEELYLDPAGTIARLQGELELATEELKAEQFESSRLTDRNRALSEALEKFGIHTKQCPVMNYPDSKCNCGLIEAISGNGAP